MLTMPRNASSIVTLIGIDPGSDSLGVAVLTIDLSTLKIIASTANTFFGSRMIGKESWIADLHSNRTSRINAHEENLLGIFNHYKPMSITSESPYISSSFPQAGLVLTEVVCAIRRAVMRYDSWQNLNLIDPPTIKKAVGAMGNAKKDIMREKVLLLPDLCYNGIIPLEELDEHSIDALSAAYCHWNNLRNRYV